MFCLVVLLKLTGVWEVLTASIVMAFSPWWWRSYTPLKHQSVSRRLHSTTFHKTAIFMLTAVRTWNLTRRTFCIAALNQCNMKYKRSSTDTEKCLSIFRVANIKSLLSLTHTRGACIRTYLHVLFLSLPPQYYQFNGEVFLFFYKSVYYLSNLLFVFLLFACINCELKVNMFQTTECGYCV
jgi:hypothetical protein